MKTEKIKITFLQGFQDELNMSAEKYYCYYNTKNITDLRYALKSTGDACNLGLLYLLKKHELPIFKTNGHTLPIQKCILLLETDLTTNIAHKKEFNELLEIRNKLVHNEFEMAIQSAINFLDKAIYSLAIVFDEHEIDIFKYILNNKCSTFMKTREAYYQNKVKRNVIFLNRDNYLYIKSPIINCPFCGEQDSCYLMLDEKKYHCALCEVEDASAHCNECGVIWPSSLLNDFCEGYEDLCDDCYDNHNNKFRS